MAKAQEGWTADEDLDMDNASSAPPGPLENGIYRFDFTKVEAYTTQGGKPAVKLQLAAVEKYGDGPLERTRTVYDMVVVEKATNWKVKQLAEAAGVDAPRKSNFEQVATFIEALQAAGGCYASTKQSKQKQGINAGKVFANIDNYLTEAGANEAKNGKASAESSQPAAARPVRKRAPAAAATA